MRGRKPRAVPTKGAKLGLDTLALADLIRNHPQRPRWYESVDAVVLDGLTCLATNALGISVRELLDRVRREAAEKSSPVRSLRDTEKDPTARRRAAGG